MRVINDTNLEQQRRFVEAVESWEAANGASVLFVRGERNVPEDFPEDVLVRVGPPRDNDYDYLTYYEVPVGADGLDCDPLVYRNTTSVYDCYSTEYNVPDGFIPWDSGIGCQDGNGESVTFVPAIYSLDGDKPRMIVTMVRDWFQVTGPAFIHKMLDVLGEGLGEPELREQRRMERALAAIGDYFREGSTADLRNLRGEIGDLVRRVGEYEETLLRDRHDLAGKRAHMDLLLDQMGATDAANQAQMAWVAMQERPQIESVSFVAPNLTIKTVGLDIEHPATGETGYLGKFTITLNIQTGGVKLKNEDNAKSGYDHPHIYMGRPCFGEMGNTIMEFTRRGQLLDAVDMVFVFLGSVNLQDDWSRSLAFWIGDQLERPVTEDAELVEDVLPAGLPF